MRCSGNPPFRIACRAADWYGSTDRTDIEAASPNGKITVLLLEPLRHEDILHILRENHGITDSQSFVEEAEKRGIADLLDNPQTLELLVAAVSGEQWPKTRNETYQLACEKLATEANKRHRNRRRSVLLSVEKVLDAAGQLCAVLLFSDKTGIALDRENIIERFLSLLTLLRPIVRLRIKPLVASCFVQTAKSASFQATAASQNIWRLHGWGDELTEKDRRYSGF